MLVDNFPFANRHHSAICDRQLLARNAVGEMEWDGGHSDEAGVRKAMSYRQGTGLIGRHYQGGQTAFWHLQILPTEDTLIALRNELTMPSELLDFMKVGESRWWELTVIRETGHDLAFAGPFSTREAAVARAAKDSDARIAAYAVYIEKLG